MSTMSRPTLKDATIAMRIKRLTLPPLFPSLADHAEAERLYREAMGLSPVKPVGPVAPTVVVPNVKPEPPVQRKPKCYTHVEWYFTFSDGVTWSRCRHSDCGFGVTHKRHSDGTKAGGYFYGDTPVPEIALPDQPAEIEEPLDEAIDERPPLIAEPVERVAGEELVDQTEVEPEEESEDEFAAVAAQFDRDEEP